MITDDEVLQLFERADPARGSDDEATVDAAGYLDALRTRSTDMTLVENPPRRSDGKPRTPRWLMLSAAAAVVVVLLGALVIANRGDPAGVVTDQTPVATSAPPTPAPDAVPTEAEIVAASFFAAYAAYDADAIAAALAPDADVSGLWNPPDWRLGLGFLRATGTEFIAGECHEQDSSPAGVRVRCPFAYHALRSNEIGLGPYSGNYMDITVRDGQIVSTSAKDDFMRNGFFQQMSAFAAWASSAYPEDALVMYTDSSRKWARITEQSIPLWEQRTQEYVPVAKARAPYLAEATRICQAATDQLVRSSDGVGADLEMAARLAEQSLADLRSLLVPEGDAALASQVDQLIARSGQYIDVLDQIAAFDGAAVPQALVARRVALKVELDATVPGLIGCPIRVAG